MPFWAAVAGQSVLFGLIHGNPLQVFYAAALGIPLALVYHWTGSLSAPILLHMVFNAGNYMIIPLLSVSGFVSLHLLVGGPVLAVFCLHWLRKDARVHPGHSQIYE
jgi:membrane protease YdiL (CAAX protease family)